MADSFPRGDDIAGLYTNLLRYIASVNWDTPGSSDPVSEYEALLAIYKYATPLLGEFCTLDAYGCLKKRCEILLSKRSKRFLVHPGVAKDRYLPREVRVKGEGVILCMQAQWPSK